MSQKNVHALQITIIYDHVFPCIHIKALDVFTREALVLELSKRFMKKQENYALTRQVDVKDYLISVSRKKLKHSNGRFDNIDSAVIISIVSKAE